MIAYNPNTGQRIEISEYGFKMIENKGWRRDIDQTVRRADVPQSDNPGSGTVTPVVDMKAEMEKRRAEVQQSKYHPVIQPKPANNHEVTLDDIPAEQPFPELPETEPPVQTVAPAKKTAPKKNPRKQSTKNKSK